MVLKQSRKASSVEALVNIAVGFGINMVVQIAIFAWFGVVLPIRDSFIIGFVFTLISFCRSYLLRRLFETLRIKGLLP